MRIELQLFTDKVGQDIAVFAYGRHWGYCRQLNAIGNVWFSESANDGIIREFASIRDAIRHLLGRIK